MLFNILQKIDVKYLCQLFLKIRMKLSKFNFNKTSEDQNSCNFVNNKVNLYQVIFFSTYHILRQQKHNLNVFLNLYMHTNVNMSFRKF